MDNTTEKTTPLEELEDPRHFPGAALWVIGGLLILLVALGFYFRAAKPPAGAGVKVADVTQHPKDFVGRTVTVRGDVEKVIGARAFILEDEGPGGEMLVVQSPSTADKNPPISELAEIDDLRIVGEVRPFDANAVQSDVGVPATDDRLKDVQGKPVLYAFQVIVPPGSKVVMQ